RPVRLARGQATQAVLAESQSSQPVDRSLGIRKRPENAHHSSHDVSPGCPFSPFESAGPEPSSERASLTVATRPGSVVSPLRSHVGGEDEASSPRSLLAAQGSVLIAPCACAAH